MATDGTLSFDTKIDDSGLDQGVSKAESSLKAILGELRKISSAISSIPSVKVSADTSEVTAAKEAIDDIPKNTEVEIDIEADPREIVETEDAIDDVGGAAERTADEASKAFKKASKNAGTAVDSSCDGILKKLSGTLGKVKVLIAAAGIGAAIKGIVSFGSEAVEKAAEVTAATSQLTQSFGAMQQSAEDAIKRVADQSGILETRLKGVGTSIYAFAKTSAMDSTTALTMMEEALQVAADSAAYYDRSLEDTSETLKSFLKGNYANDAALGLSATETTRNATAMKMYGKSFQELSEAQKQLTLLQMVKDANALSGAMGQAARESDGWENVLGNLKEAWKQLLAVVGQPILYYATIAVKQITSAIEYLTARAREAVAVLSDLFGVEFGSTAGVADNISQAVENQQALTNAVEDTEKAQKGSLAAFDQLNTVSSDKDSSAGSSASSVLSNAMAAAAETKQSEKSLSNFAKKVKDTFGKLREWLRTSFGTTFKGIWDGLKEEGSELWQTFKDIFQDIQSLGGPLLEYFNSYFVPFLNNVFGLVGKVLIGLLDTFNQVFADIWNIVIYPYLQTYITVGLPMLTEFASELVTTFGTIFDEVKKIFDMLWADVAKPVLSFIMKMWQDVMQAFKAFWDKWGAPIFEKLRKAIQNASDAFSKMWNNVYKPIFDKLMAKVDEIWDKHMKVFLEHLLEFVGTFIDAALEIYNGFIAPLVGWFAEKFGPPIVATIGEIISMVGSMLENVIDSAIGIIDALKGIVDFVVGAFTGDWERAWNGIKETVSGVMDSLVSIVKVPLNLIIGNFNMLITGLNNMIDGIIDALGDLDFDIPSWVPGIGGKSFHLDLSGIHIPRIPYLAQGTVIPANYGNFLAMLGDNKREAEVVSPVSTMKQAMLEALAEAGGSGPKEITLYTYLYPNSAAYHREVISIVNAEARNRGE